jgi:ABC-2 type transport system ATP-binding protein/lipopolysaccharide transport system ATP-binding protein
MALIRASHLSLDMAVLSADSRSLKKRLLSAYARPSRVTIDERSKVIVRILRDISFEISDGDRVGLIGRNGAGKSSLLRVLAGVYSPTTGSLEISGNVVPLLNLGVGIRVDSTGYENIRICGLLLGMKYEELEEKTQEIADFTELGDYLSLPLHTYSAGMRMRLAFGIATAVEPDILLVDENVSAGDAAFIKKAEARMNRLMRRSSVVVLATHSNEMIERDCNKAILLDQGQIVAYGPSAEVLDEYRRRLDSAPVS